MEFWVYLGRQGLQLLALVYGFRVYRVQDLLVGRDFSYSRGFMVLGFIGFRVSGFGVLDLILCQDFSYSRGFMDLGFLGFRVSGFGVLDSH